MQRLTRLRRHTDERGAVVILVAFLMTAIVGFAAIAIDVADMWSQRQRLQTGADAGALAVGQDCANYSCGVPAETATAMANANFGGGSPASTVIATVRAFSASPGRVTIRTSAVSRHLFAPILGPGLDSSTISAQATVTWGAPTGGTAVLPLIFSWCAFQDQTGGGVPSGATEQTIQFSKDDGTTCHGPSGNEVPGGFGWVTAGLVGCMYDSAIGGTVTSDPGNSIPNGCSGSDFIKEQNQTVLLPVFDAGDAGATGSNAWYKVYGYAAFKLTGYKFPSISWNASGCIKNCVKGYFTKFVSIDDAFTYGAGAPQLGLTTVNLDQ